MKRMRKLLTVMLTAVLVMMMGMSAMATAPTDPDEPNVDIKGSIKVTNAIEGESYTLYKVFRATVSDGRIEGQNGISYKSDWTVPENDYFAVDDQGNVVYEGTKKDDNGNDVAFKETVDEKTGFILREHTDAYDLTTKRNFVVFGNITGKYWGDTAAPEVPTNAPSNDQQNTTKVPDPSQDATSNSGSTSDSAGNNNGAIATGDFSAAALIGVVAIAGLGVFYFVRKRRSSK